MSDVPQRLDYRQFPSAYAQALNARPRRNPAMEAAVTENLIPYFNPAVKQAEGNPRNFGVLSQQVDSPAQANQVLNQSITNNFLRWQQAGMPGKFVDFMADRWAPVGVANDPKNLNKNWTGNVRKSLKNQLGPKAYERWKKLNLVMAPPWGGTA